jgi:hypothetical protein
MANYLAPPKPVSDLGCERIVARRLKSRSRWGQGLLWVLKAHLVRGIMGLLWWVLRAHLRRDIVGLLHLLLVGCVILNPTRPAGRDISVVDVAVPVVEPRSEYDEGYFPSKDWIELIRGSRREC